jgi:uncharacterized protein (TIGR03435 family)
MKHPLFEKRAVLFWAALFMAIPALYGQKPEVPAAENKPATAADTKRAPATSAAAKPPAGGWAFEVATIKPAKMINPADVMHGKAHVGMKTDAARVDIGFMSLSDLIGIAYKVKDYQISGPDWMNALDHRFDILAKMPEGATKDQVPEMMQALLAERFNLAIHHETKDRAVYALVVGKGGSKLKEVPPDPPPAPPAEKADAGPGDPAEAAPAADATPQFKVQRGADGQSGTATVHGPDGDAKMSFSPTGMHIDLVKITMEKLAEMLGRFVDRPVVDLTELKGSYQVALDISMEDLKNVARKFGAPVPGVAPASGDAGLPSDAASDPAGSVFTSVQQLGLKLEPRKAPLDLIVVEHVEKTPTEN